MPLISATWIVLLWTLCGLTYHLHHPIVEDLKTIDLLAQATGDYTRAELNKDAVLGWTDLAQSQIDAAKQPEP